MRASTVNAAPLTELLKPNGCRAPPRSSHRAAGARQHQRRALRAHGKCVRVRSTPVPRCTCRPAPADLIGRAPSSPRICEQQSAKKKWRRRPTAAAPARAGRSARRSSVAQLAGIGGASRACVRAAIMVYAAVHGCPRRQSLVYHSGSGRPKAAIDPERHSAIFQKVEPALAAHRTHRDDQTRRRMDRRPR